MRIALQHLPVLVPGDHGDVLDVPVGLEEPADRFVAQVVEVKIVDRQVAADAPERGANRPAVVGEDEPLRVAGALALLLDEGDGIESGVGDERDRLVVRLLLPWMFALPHPQGRPRRIEVLPEYATDLVLAERGGNGEPDDAPQWDDLARIGLGRLDDQVQLLRGRSALALGRLCDEAQAIERDASEPYLLYGHFHAVDGGCMLEHGPDEADVDADCDWSGTLLSAPLGKIDEEVAREPLKASSADRLTQAEESVLFAPANASSQFLQVGQVKVDDAGERLPALGGR